MPLTISPPPEAVEKLFKIFEKGISEKSKNRASAIFGEFERYARHTCGVNPFDAVSYIVRNQPKSDPITKTKNTEESGEFQCVKCQKSFKTVKGLHGHQKLHR
jgi:hypothetical protein